MDTFDIVFACVISVIFVIVVIILFLVDRAIIREDRLRRQQESFNLANWPSNSTTLYPPRQSALTPH